ncbi:hypothetical protein [Vibrio atlanticus]|uniref:hypothetical protein n=1 Tax=Vibrio atlanticus TaxID=693153 RepID=UPI00354E0C57
MAAETFSWWDGFVDGAGELASDLAGGAQSYQNRKAAEAKAEAAKASATRAANENATVTERARIADQRRLDREDERADKDKKMYLFAGVGVALLIVLALIFKK